MPEYLAPGVFVEEIDSGSKPIEGVGTNTAAFIGYAKSGDFNKPTFISNWTQFCQNFGEEENALTKALVDELGVAVSDVRTAKFASRKSWTEYASQAIQKGIAEKKVSVKSWQEFLRKYKIPQTGLPYMDDAYLAHSVRGYYDNGGTRAYIIRVARPADIEALSYTALNAAPTTKTQPIAAKTQVGPLLLTAAKAGEAGNDIRVGVEHIGDNDFKLHIRQGELLEVIPEGNAKPLNSDNAVAAVNKASKLLKATLVEAAPLVRPEPMEYVLAGGKEVGQLETIGETALTAGSSGKEMATLRADDFVGDEAQRSGVSGLLPLEDVNFICAPDLMAGVWKREALPAAANGSIGPETLNLDERTRQLILDQQCAMVAFCERMADRCAILDPLPGLTPQQMNETTLATAYNCDHGQASIYYPWIKVIDPLHRGEQKLVPPCGHIAGVWARVAVERGVHKAPANEALIGCVALETSVTKGEQELLNPNGINCIRSFPGRGIRVWGARTLATIGNPSWKYVNVRRLFNYLEKSLDRSLQWVVFEPNDQDLWGRVRRNIAAFLWTEWKEGKLFGATPAEAYYVKCDAETNPQEMIDLGRMYVEIGVNPVKPAEFVIIRIGQWAGGGNTGEE